MKSLLIQIKGLIICMFLVFIIISYYNLTPDFAYADSRNEDNAFGEKGKGGVAAGQSRGTSLLKRKGSSPMAKKRMAVVLIALYIYLNLQLIIGGSDINKNISIKDGKILITEAKKIKIVFLKLVAGLVIYNQSNFSVGQALCIKEKYIILLTNLLGITFLI